MRSRVLYTSIDKNTNIDISFVIPTYKRTRYLNNAIDSILNLRKQELFCYEIVVINNDPNDNMESLINNYKHCRISFYSNEENYGQVGNINQGINLADGKYVSLLHDDDLLLENYFEVFDKYLNGKENYDCIVPSYYEFYDKYRIDLKHKIERMFFPYRLLYRKELHLIPPLGYLYCFKDIYNAPTCGTIFLKKALVDYGMFKNEYGASWDYYNYREFNKSHKIYVLHKYVGAKRMYVGMSNEAAVKEDFLIHKKALINEFSDNSFIKKYKSCLVARKPLLMYLCFRVHTEIFLYGHNLDANKTIPYYVFRKLKKKFYI